MVTSNSRPVRFIGQGLTARVRLLAATATRQHPGTTVDVRRC
jgi:hypothetical protein